MSIRLRVATVFTLALALAFALGSWLLATQLHGVVVRSVDARLATKVMETGQLVPSPAPSSRPAPPPALLPGDYVIQLIDPAGHVRAAAGPAGAASPLLNAGQEQLARHKQIIVTTTIHGDAERVLAEPARARPGWIAVAATSLEGAEGTVSAVVTRVAIGGSVFVLIAGVGAYLLARAALAPVNRLRREAAAVSAQDPAARLPVPRTRDEIAALAGTMNDLLARLHSALARQRAFVADASHELRTPFAVLSGELELAARPGRSREELADAVTAAAEEAARLARITDDLLTLAGGDERQLTISAVPAVVRDVLARSAEQAARRAAGSGVTVQVSAAPELEASIDADRIRQAVDNLTDNALRFAPPGSRVDLSAEASGPDVVISVADGGPGFPADFLPHAFERFARADGVRARARTAGGAGLGLAVVAAIAAAHGGTVTAGNRPDGGAIVQLRLPGARVA
jgi:two-component system, OmpR family, sensor kinase